MPVEADISRLDWMIARLNAQKKALEYAATQITDIPGPVFEVGLGKGRTWSHLKMLFPGRRITAFDRELHAPAAATPDPEDVRLGEFSSKLQEAKSGPSAALIHADFGSEDAFRDSETAAMLSEILPELSTHMGIVAADRALESSKLEKIRLDTGQFPYFLYRTRND